MVKHECMSETVVLYEIKNWLRNLTFDSPNKLKIEIKPCNVLKATYELKIIELKEVILNTKSDT